MTARKPDARTAGAWIAVPKSDLDSVVNSVVGNTSGTVYMAAMRLRARSETEPLEGFDTLLAQRDNYLRHYEIAAKRLDEVITERDKLAEALRDSLETLERIDCQFWACKGPYVPAEDMITCVRCQSLTTARAALALVDGAAHKENE